MKTRTLLSTTVFLLCSLILQAQTTYVPDNNFEQALIDLGIDSDGTINQSVATSDISGLTYLNVYNKNINDLTGIEGFISLTNLYCSHNQLTSLDVTQNTALTILYCPNNQLASLDVTQNTALTHLYCNNNQLISLDVTQNTALSTLNCHYNQITSLDVTQNTALSTLNCHYNQLTSLDVTQNTALSTLSCYYNQLTSLDITQNTALAWLYCYNNQLTSLDVSQNTALTYLLCSNNQLTSLDVSQNTALSTFTCRGNQLTSLDISQNTALTYLWCYDNQLTSLDLTQNTALSTLYCHYNQITSLDVSQNTALRYLWCYDNQLTSLDLTQNTPLRYLDCHTNQLTCLDVRNGNNSIMWYLNATNNPSLSCISVDDKTADHSAWHVDPGVVFSNDCCNLPPVAVCQDVTVNANEYCEAIVTPEQVDNNSYDPDGDPITLSLDPPGPFQLGDTPVTLTVEDDSGETDQCTATVTVIDVTPPIITTNTDPIQMNIVIWPPNHQYETFLLSDFVSSVWDNCASLTINDVNIVKATSDEPEDAVGTGDGNTLVDMVIAVDCKSVQLRKERNGNGNGRVYNIYLELNDDYGNTGSATCQIQVPVNNNGTAIDDGAVYEVLGDCDYKSFPIAGNENPESEIKLFNYPNPFNSSTTFVFSVDEAAKTSLKVYNSIGREIIVLFDGYAEADQDYEIIFKAEGLPEGLYICHMQSGDTRRTNKILLAR